jgi:hypothetical protein
MNKKFYKTYSYKERAKTLEEYKQQVLCVIDAKENDQSFAQIAKLCKIPDRAVCWGVSHMNKSDKNICRAWGL